MQTMGTPIEVGEGIFIVPSTYRLQFCPPGWTDVSSMFFRHGTVEVDCVEWDINSAPLWWAVTFLGYRLTHDGEWKKPPHRKTEEEFEEWREKTQFAVPEIAVCHAFKHKDKTTPK